MDNNLYLKMTFNTKNNIKHFQATEKYRTRICIYVDWQ